MKVLLAGNCGYNLQTRIINEEKRKSEKTPGVDFMASTCRFLLGSSSGTERKNAINSFFWILRAELNFIANEFSLKPNWRMIRGWESYV